LKTHLFKVVLIASVILFFVGISFAASVYDRRETSSITNITQNLFIANPISFNRATEPGAAVSNRSGSSNYPCFKSDNYTITLDDEQLIGDVTCSALGDSYSNPLCGNNKRSEWSGANCFFDFLKFQL
jgi:spore coat protein U-like protein